MILEDIENLRNNYNRDKIVLDCQFGLNVMFYRLKKLLMNYQNLKKRLTRRIRQISNKIKRQLSHKNPNNKIIIKIILKKTRSGFHKLFPKLDRVF